MSKKIMCRRCSRWKEDSGKKIGSTNYCSPCYTDERYERQLLKDLGASPWPEGGATD